MRFISLLFPALALTGLVFFLPVLIFLVAGVVVDGKYSPLAYIQFFTDPLNVSVLLRTLKLSACVTILAAAIGYAAAISITSLPQRTRHVVIILIIIPLMISPVARTYAWIVILARDGILNNALL